MHNSSGNESNANKESGKTRSRKSKPRDASRHSIKRYLDMLQIIPRDPNSISTKGIYYRLIDLGYDVSLKTVQRDLMKLMDDYNLFYEEKEGGYSWRYLPGTPTWVFPCGLEEYTALSVVMAGKFLSPILPVEFEAMPSFESAQSRLKICRRAEEEIARRNNPVAQWAQKVYWLPEEFVRPRIAVSNEIRDVIYTALEFDQWIWLKYMQQEDAQPAEYMVFPLGVICRGNALYLVAYDDKDGAILKFLLSRIIKVSDGVMVVDGEAAALRQPPKDFDLETFALENFEADKGKSQTQLVTLRVSEELASELVGQPIAKGQRIKKTEHGYMVQATVRNIISMRRFILSLGKQVEVLEPAALREEIAREVIELAGHYS